MTYYTTYVQLKLNINMGRGGTIEKSHGRRMYLYRVLFCILEENYRTFSSTYLFVF